MNTLVMNDILLLMAGSLFFLGFGTFVLGVFILITKALGRQVKTITQEATNLTQKGITDDIAGLVGNASILLSEMNSLVKTAAGIGIFLILTGLLLLAASYWLVLQINWPI